MTYKFKAVATFDFCVGKHKIKEGETLWFSAEKSDDNLFFESFHITSETDSFGMNDIRDWSECYDCFRITEIEKDCLKDLMQFFPEFPMFYADEGIKAGLVHLVPKHTESLLGLEDADIEIDGNRATFTYGDFLIDHDYIPFFYRVIYDKETDTIKAERCYFDEHLLDAYYIEAHMTSEQYQSLYIKVINTYAIAGN